MTYQQILDRDVPEIVQGSRDLSRQGIVGNTVIYYRHEAICGMSDALGFKPTNADWKDAKVVIPCNVPWDQWNNYLRNRLGSCLLFA